jgi:RNA polymerase sigma-70 factor (ECF subfamily)
MHEDEELVSRIRQGDLGAFEALYDKYKLPLYRTALAITRDRGTSEELLQDAFVRAYAALDRVDASVPLSPWLHRIVLNLSYNHVKRKQHLSVALDEVLDGLTVATHLRPEEQAEGNEVAAFIREAVNSLSFKRRVVIVLYYLQGFSLQEIAYILDCPVGTVKSRLHYASKALRAKLSKDRRLNEVLSYATS